MQTADYPTIAAAGTIFDSKIYFSLTIQDYDPKFEYLLVSCGLA